MSRCDRYGLVIQANWDAHFSRVNTGLMDPLDVIDSAPIQCDQMMEQKVAYIPSNIAQKVATHFLHNKDIIRNSPKIHQNIWATFVRQFVAKKL